MSRIDRYLLRQIAGPFLFFVLVFTGVIWLSQSLRVIDTVVNNGQSATVFLEFTALLLPRVMSVVIPVAAFAATLYAINRLFGDSEIVAMLASGMSGTALFRPVLVFSLGLLVLLYGITLYGVPTAQRQIRERITEIRGDVATAFLREGAFLNPSPGVTVYVRRMGRPGEMFGIFVHDRRDVSQIATYTAQRALLLHDASIARLVMIDGVVQVMEGENKDTLSLLRFDQLAYDLAGLGGSKERPDWKPSELYLPRLLTITDAESGRRNVGEFRAEAHEALSAPLYVVALPLLAIAFVVSAGFSRRGFLGRIVMAAGAALALRFLGLAAKSLTGGTAVVAPLMYLPPLIAIALAWWLMSDAGQLRRFRRRQRPPLSPVGSGP